MEKQDSQFSFSDERFADLQMLRYRLNGFENLSLSQQLYIYYLSKATLMGRDITFDQNGKYNLRIRKTLEAIFKHYEGDRSTAGFKALEVYLKRVWFSSGIYHHYGCEKFKPEFSEAFFYSMVEALPAECLPLKRGENKEDLLDELVPVIFDETILPKRVNQTDGEDLIATSACNFYAGVTQQEVEAFYQKMKDEAVQKADAPQGDDAAEDTDAIQSDSAPHADGDQLPSFGLNSKLVKRNGEMVELVWNEEGLYGNAIKEIVSWLRKAQTYAENEQQKHVIDLLVKYYHTGDLGDFDKYSIAWVVQQEGMVDFVNGFIEVYGDPLGLKGTWEGIVEYKDLEATRRTNAICQNAQWFEDHSPVNPEFRKPEVKGVTAHVICAAMLGGDEYPASAIGINLPNSNWIRETYGSKSVTIGNLTEAYNKAARGNGFRDEFVIDRETVELIDQYGDLTDDLHTDLHECLGHGSGRLLPGTDADALKAYGNTIEEARADLFGLYYIADEKLIQLGLLPDGEAYKAQYYSYMMNGLLTQCIRIKEGDKIEEAHMRNRALIAQWTLAHYPQAVRLVKASDSTSSTTKTYVEVLDYPALRKAFAELLAEIQRIKSEGDFEAARELVETYAVNIDPVVHHEILERYKKLDLAPYKGFINPWMKLEHDEDGHVVRVNLDYTESYEHQMLRYSEEYATL